MFEYELKVDGIMAFLCDDIQELRREVEMLRDRSRPHEVFTFIYRCPDRHVCFSMVSAELPASLSEQWFPTWFKSRLLRAA